MTTQLIPVTPHAVGSETIPTVDARELHTFLEVGKDFSSWMKERIESFDFALNQDFIVFTETGEKGRPRTEYALTLDMAKEISMVERNAKGKEARQYFIECERQAKAQHESPMMVMSRAVLLADKTIKEQAEQIAVLEPKAAFYDAVANSSGLILIREAAKVLAVPNLGQNTLYKILRHGHVLMESNEPYQRYINMEYFMVRERQYTVKEEVKVSRTTMVTQKGLDFLRRLVVKNMKSGFFVKGPAVWEMPDDAVTVR